MNKALHPREDIDRLYALRKERRRWLDSTLDSVETSIQQLEDNIEKDKDRLITAT